MDKLRIGELFAKLKPRILELINTVGGGSGPFAPTPHDLNSPHHTGSLVDNQAPQFLKVDGSRDLIGNLNVANGITIDGVDLSVFKSAYDVHLTTDAHTIYAHAEGSGTRRAYEAGRLNKSILAGNGLTGGGLLTADRTLSVLLNASWSGLSVDSNGLRINTAAAFTWTNDHVFQGLTKTRHLQPELTDTYDLGTSTLLWRKGWLSELDAILFAQNTVTLLGGWLIISKDEGAIDADVAPSDTQINFGKAMTSGDFVLLRAAGKVEYVQIGSLVSGTTYNVTRNLDGSGADSWPAGTPFAVLGQSGQGRIELNAYDTPRIQLIRQGATYNTQTEIIRIGDLNGNWGYTSQKWGVAIGEYASGKANITIDQDGVLRIRNFATDVIRLSGADATLENVLKIAGTSSAIAIGNPPPTSSTAGTGLWLDRTGLYGLQSDVRQAYFGSDGKLYAGGGNVIIDNKGIKLKGVSSFSEENSITFRNPNNLNQIFGRIWTDTNGTFILESFPVADSSNYGISLNNIVKSSTPKESWSQISSSWYNLSDILQQYAYVRVSSYGEGGGYDSHVFMTAGNAQSPYNRIEVMLNSQTEALEIGYGLLDDAPYRAVNFKVNAFGGYIEKSTAIACRVIRTSVQSIPNNSWTAISFSSAVFDDRPSSLSAHWSSGSPTRITIRVTGTYYIAGSVMFDTNTTGTRIAGIRRNGSTFIFAQTIPPSSSVNTIVNCGGIFKLDAGDYIELMAFQNSGANLNVTYDSSHSHSPVLSIARIA